MGQTKTISHVRQQFMDPSDAGHHCYRMAVLYVGSVGAHVSPGWLSCVTGCPCRVGLDARPVSRVGVRIGSRCDTGVKPIREASAARFPPV